MPTFNGLSLLRCRLEEPRTGIWTADVEVDSETDITGAAALDLDGTAYTGTVYRGGLDSGRWLGRIVGGAGGMSIPACCIWGPRPRLRSSLFLHIWCGRIHFREDKPCFGTC